METEGLFAPESPAAVRERYAELADAAEATVEAAAREQATTGEEYDDLTAEPALAAGREALFAALLAVRVGDRAEFGEWRERSDSEVELLGSEGAEGVAWHAPAFADRAVAVTFHEERGAAVGTLRRQAFGRLYRPLLEESA